MNNESSVLIEQLVDLQTQKADAFYEPGLWRSQRYNSLFRFCIEDNNLFVSAAIAYILDLVCETVDKSDKVKIDTMLNLFKKRLDDYKNKDEKASYNFWRTIPSDHFPNGKICSKLDYFRLPDDADDTSLVYLIHPEIKIQLKQFQKLLAEHSNLAKKQIKKVDPQFRNLPAYTTFFAERMPNEFDICVQCNILSVFYKYNLNFDEHSKATIEFIKECIKEDHIQKKPFHIAPNYARSSIIFYHICRLIYYSGSSDFSDCLDLLKKQILAYNPPTSFDSLLINICRKLLDLETLSFDFNVDNKIPFFIAGMFSAFDNPLAQMIAPWHFTHIQFHSLALNTALLLHYHCLD